VYFGNSADSDVNVEVEQPRRNDTPLTLFAVFLVVALASTLAYLLGKKRGNPPPPPPPSRTYDPDEPRDPWSGPG
jgi:CDP-diglyceride synthetase